MSEPELVLKAKLLREGGYGPATVKGGPYASTQTMDWQLVDSSGESVGLVRGEPTATLINDLVELRELLGVLKALEHIKARYDSGYLEVPPVMITQLEKLLKAKT